MENLIPQAGISAGLQPTAWASLALRRFSTSLMLQLMKLSFSTHVWGQEPGTG